MRKRNKLGRMLNQAGISGTKPMKTRAQEKTASFFIEEQTRIKNAKSFKNRKKKNETKSENKKAFKNRLNVI